MSPEEPTGKGEVTRLLGRLSDGDTGAAGALLPLLYDELRRVAGRLMIRERAGHTLQPTALVHEAWMRLIDAGESSSWNNRAHFVSVAARAMRNVLVDHARRRNAEKRGGDHERVPLDSVLSYFEERSLGVIELSEAVDRLQEVDEQLARIVELRFFAGLTIDQTARVLAVSTPTVERGWRVARMWLREQLGGDEEADDGA